MRERQITSDKYIESTVDFISPHKFLVSELKVKNIALSILPSLSVDNFFLQPTQEQLDLYDNEVIKAVRTRDMKELRRMHRSGRSFQTCNRFGESLIHMACRRGFEEVVTFLMHEASVSIRVRDDFGRTPLHDACWASEPNLELMDLLIDAEPMLLFMSDKRGHTPFDYVRKEHWDMWIEYLKTRINLLRAVTAEE